MSTRTIVYSVLKKDSALRRFFIEHVLENQAIFHDNGWRGLINERGRKSASILMTYYFFRHSVIYILIPFVVALKFLQ